MQQRGSGDAAEALAVRWTLLYSLGAPGEGGSRRPARVSMSPGTGTYVQEPVTSEVRGMADRSPRTRRGEASMRDPVKVGPFAFYRHGGHGPSGATDAVYVEQAREDGMAWLVLPQLGIEVCGKEVDEQLLTDLVRRILAFYAGLRELPEEFVNEVERAQIALIEERFLPWLGAELGKHPTYFTLPGGTVVAPVAQGDLARA